MSTENLTAEAKMRYDASDRVTYYPVRDGAYYDSEVLTDDCSVIADYDVDHNLLGLEVLLNEKDGAG